MDYEIIYRKRAENRVTDALFRLSEEEGEVNDIFGVQPAWIQDMEKSYEGDEQVLNLVTILAIQSDNYQDYKLTSGVLRYKGKIYVGKATNLRQQMLGIMYTSALGGHSGQLGTLKRLQLYFYWPAMKKDVQVIVSTYDIFQGCKDENVAPSGLLQLLAIPTQSWSDISRDFIEGLPLSGGKNANLVIVDRFNMVTS